MAIVLALGIGGGIFGYTQYRAVQTINEKNIVSALTTKGYKNGNLSELSEGIYNDITNVNGGDGLQAFNSSAKSSSKVYSKISVAYDFSPNGKENFYIYELKKGEVPPIFSQGFVAKEDGWYLSTILSSGKITTVAFKSFSQIPRAN